MSLIDRVYNVATRFGMAKPPSVASYQIPTSKAFETAKLSHSGLAEIFYANKGRVVDKWTHYLDAYERHFASYREAGNVHMLEIGVFQGGSLELWRKYFGDDATIFGVDINPECAKRVDAPNQVRIGSQDDPSFLRSVASELGEIDIILDDGSHVAKHQLASFDVLFPLLRDGGIYVIEDLHTAYWPGGYEGGYRRKGSAIELVKQIIDDMHSTYHNKGFQTVAKDSVAAIHIYDSMVFLEKAKKQPPHFIRIGQGAS